MNDAFIAFQLTLQYSSAFFKVSSKFKGKEIQVQ